MSSLTVHQPPTSQDLASDAVINGANPLVMRQLSVVCATGSRLEQLERWYLFVRDAIRYVVEEKSEARAQLREMREGMPREHLREVEEKLAEAEKAESKP